MSGFAHSVVLRSGLWTAEVLPQFGMNMVSLRYDGQPILREAGEMQRLAESPFLYGIPLLFPANRTAGGQFTFGGTTYHLPINEPAFQNHLHGLMYDAPFAVIFATESQVTAVYENGGERYPFPFRMVMNDALKSDGMTRTLFLTNTGDTPMAYTLAFHTAFAEPNVFSAEIGSRHERSATFVPTGNTEEMTETEMCYRTGICPRGIAISGYYSAAGTSALLDDTVFDMSPNFDQRVLFNGGGQQGFLCVEPQAGMVNGLNMPSGHKVLLPGTTETYTVTIRKAGSE